ncbi:hypothetical protein ETB97_008565 [Aspergillus alliaceus]|uniref:DUF6536 domain-containing protein n=1 Tax=Petromyces alliaceus TaxID=209559 RepID=A0A8H5ZV13_PETAA|nr:hypothetical protein ETB97_008565 [Aspergillus burnettii]
MMGIIGSRLIMGRVKSSSSRQRSHGDSEPPQGGTELVVFHDLPSEFLFSLDPEISRLSAAETSQVDEEVTPLLAITACRRLSPQAERKLINSTARGRWLDVGSASVKNLFAIGRDRLGLWVVLLVTTTPFHLLYNSMIFQSFSPNQYIVVAGPKDLDSQNIWDLTTPALEKCFLWPASNGSVALGDWHDFASNIARGNYERLTTQQCIDFHTGSNHVGIKALVALADNLTVSDGGDASILLATPDGLGPGNNPDGRIVAASFSKQTYSPQEHFATCSIDQMPNCLVYDILGCLAIKAEEHCQLLYSPPICIIITLTLWTKVMTMFLTARIGRSRSAPLLTVGDAVASFMAKPDPTTEGICWISSADIRHGQWKSHHRTQEFAEMSAGSSNQHKQITYNRLTRRKFWMKAPSITLWLATLTLWLMCIGAGVYLFVNPWSPWSGYLLSKSRSQQLWSFGDDTNSYEAVEGQYMKNGPILNSIVIANTPQLFITISYYCYNSVLTSMLAAAEYSSYGVNRKPLRVTWPIKGSQQRSTYWLSVPYQYSIPILTIYMSLHWLVSQSIFYIRAIPYSVRDQPMVEAETSSVAFSPLPMFLSVLVVGVMVCILAWLALRRFKSVMPLAGACSAAISAACHPPKDDSLDTAALGMVIWGETIAPPAWITGHFEEVEDQKGHCGFTSLDTVRPLLTKIYA